MAVVTLESVTGVMTMTIQKQHVPMLVCLTLGALTFLLPLKPAESHIQPPPPTPPESAGRAEATLRLGRAATVRVGLGQSRVMRGPGEVPLAVEITGGEPMPAGHRALVLCVDRSGSMAGDNIRWARAAGVELVQGLGDEDEISVVSFASEARVDVAPVRVGSARPEVIRLLQGLPARGGTNLSGGMRLAREQAARSQVGIKRIILLSDGIPTEGDVRPGALRDLAAQLSESGVTLTALGLGSQAPGGLMERLAVAGGGNFRFLRDGRGIQAALADEARDTGRLAASEVSVEVNLPVGARVESMTGAEWAPRSGGWVLTVRDVVAGQVRHAVALIRFDDVPRVTQVSAQAGLGREVLKAPGTQLALTQVSDPALAGASIIPWVQAQVDLASVSHQVREAAVAYEKGRSDEARSMLRKAAGQLGKKSLAAPELKAAASRVSDLARQAESDDDVGAMSNTAHAEAFGLAL